MNYRLPAPLFRIAATIAAFATSTGTATVSGAQAARSRVAGVAPTAASAADSLKRSGGGLRLAEPDTGSRRPTVATPFGTPATRAPFATQVLTRENMPVTPTSGPAGMVEGKVAGVNVLRVNGAPGAEVIAQLRGQRDPDGYIDPLYVVDGVVLTPLVSVSSQDIESLDIESIEVLKGSVAAAMYGSRAAGGVIAITTRRGQSQPLSTTRFALRNEAGRDYNPGFFDKTTAHYYRVNAAGEFVNAAGTVVARSARQAQPGQIMENRYITPVYDHSAEFFEPGGYNNQSLIISQRRESNNFSVSYSRNQQRGTTPDASGYLRHSARFNGNQQLGDRLALSLSAAAIRGDEEPSQADFSALALAEADQSLRAKPAQGTFPYNPTVTIGAFGVLQNPLAQQLLIDSHVVRARMLASATATYKVTSWMSLDFAGSYDRSRQRSLSLARETMSGSGAVSAPTETRRSDSTFLGVLQGGVRLSRSFGLLTSRLALRGEVQREYDRRYSATTAPVTVPGLPPAGSSRASWSERRVQAELAAINLDYDGRYIVDGIYRQEHLRPTAGFTPTRRSARGAAAWMLNREQWLPFQSLSEFKLRIGRGKIERAATYGDGGVIPGAEIFGVPPFVAPLNVFWENEVGTDIALHERLRASFTYSSARSRISYQRNVPLGGAVSIPLDVASKTYEATLNARVRESQHGVRWNLLLVASRSTNITDRLNAPEFVRIENNVLTPIAKGASTTAILGKRPVRSPGELAMVHPNSQNAFALNDDGYWVPVGMGNSFRDGKSRNLWGTTVTVDGMSYPWGIPVTLRSADNQISEISSDVGDMQPDMIFGIQNQVQFKALRVHLQFAGQLGGDVYSEAKRRQYALGAHVDVDQSSKPDELRKPRAYYQFIAQNAMEPFIESATHVRLAEASLGFSLSRARFGFVRAIGAQEIFIDLVGRNLFTITGYSGENVLGNSLHQRVELFEYPRTRTFTLATGIVF